MYIISYSMKKEVVLVHDKTESSMAKLAQVKQALY